MRNPNVSGYGYGDGQYGERVYGLKSLSVSTVSSVSTTTEIENTTTTTISDVPPIKSVVVHTTFDVTATTSADVDTDTIPVVGTPFDIEITILLAQDPSRNIISTPTVEYGDTDTVIYTTEYTNNYE